MSDFLWWEEEDGDVDWGSLFPDADFVGYGIMDLYGFIVQEALQKIWGSQEMQEAQEEITQQRPGELHPLSYSWVFW